MLKIKITGPRGSGKSWAALIIRAALQSIGGVKPENYVEGEDDGGQQETMRRQKALMTQAIKAPLSEVKVTVAQINQSEQPLHAVGWVVEDLLHEADQFDALLNLAIVTTPTGATRNAFTEANIHFMAAHAALRKATKP